MKEGGKKKEGREGSKKSRDCFCTPVSHNYSVNIFHPLCMGGKTLKEREREKEKQKERPTPAFILSHVSVLHTHHLCRRKGFGEEDQGSLNRKKGKEKKKNLKIRFLLYLNLTPSNSKHLSEFWGMSMGRGEEGRIRMPV